MVTALIRAFVAVELDDTQRREVVRIQQALKTMLDHAAPGARVAWTGASSMHLTLKFLGDIDESLVGEFRAAVVSAMRAVHPIVVPLERLGGFPRLREPRNLWLSPSEDWARGSDAQRLRELAAAIDQCAEGLGVPCERRPYSPHLTLCRIKTDERRLGRALVADEAAVKTSVSVPITISSFALMKSQLAPKGAIHTRLWEIQLESLAL